MITEFIHDPDSDETTNLIAHEDEDPTEDDPDDESDDDDDDSDDEDDEAEDE